MKRTSSLLLILILASVFPLTRYRPSTQVSILPTLLQYPPSQSVTTWNNWDASGAPWGTTRSLMGNCLGASAPVTLSDWTIDLQFAPGPGSGYVFTLEVDGVDSPQQIGIYGNDFSGNTIGIGVSTNPGAHLTVRCDPVGTPNSTGIVAWRHKRTGPGTYWMTSMSGGTILKTGQVRYLAPMFGGASTDAYTEPKPCPCSGTVNCLYIQSNQDPGGTSQSYKVWFKKISGVTALAASINTGSIAANDTGHLIHVNQGDLVSFVVASSSSALASARIFVGVEFTPDVYGNCVEMNEIFPPQNSTVYNCNGVPGIPATADIWRMPMYTCTVKSFVARVSKLVSSYSQIPTGQSVDYTVLQDGGTTAVGWHCVGPTQVITDNGTSVDFADGQLLSMKCVTSAAVGNLTSVHCGYTMSVPQ